mgnify:CR=1 FL=1
MANGHPSPKTNPDYWRSRIEELDKRVCRDGAELQRTISEIVEANTGLVRAQVIEIITEELGNTVLAPGTELIVKRCIHTSADFE